ncbi:MAG: hotdog domain-containing protein [Acidovorax sp.]|nr:hotdog domain-containing protein [Acidovorax sp.]
MTTPTGTVEQTDIVFPAQANHHGTLFGGNALQLMAKAAFLAARGAAQRDVVMAGVTDVRFLAPVPVGQVLTLRAWVTRVGRSSLTVCVSGLAATLGSPQDEVLKGIFEMVAVDGKGHPTPITHAYLNQEAA